MTIYLTVHSNHHSQRSSQSLIRKVSCGGKSEQRKGEEEGKEIGGEKREEREEMGHLSIAHHMLVKNTQGSTYFASTVIIH